MEKRFKFRCWNCQREYTLFKEISSQQELIVPCPFCNVEAVVKLKPYKKEKKSLLRGDSGSDISLGADYQFPDVIPTQKPE